MVNLLPRTPVLSRSVFLLLALPLANAPAQGPSWQSVPQGNVVPSDRMSAALAYDSNRQRTVLFGGADVNSIPRTDTTWEWNGSLWLQRFPANNPPARYAHAMVYDSARQRIVMFGGRDTSQTELNDTWEWDGTNWLQATTTMAPSARIHFGMAFDSARQRTVLFGGWSPSTPFGDTWEWDGSSWTQVATTVPGPAARHAHAMVYDQHAQHTLLFGGSNPPQSQRNDLWSWDGVAWRQILTAVSPGARHHHALAYDPVHRMTVLQGGAHIRGALRDDSWAWNGAAWIELSGPQVTPARAFASTTYDESRGRVCLFGGRDGARGVPGESTLNDAWEIGPFPAGSYATYRASCAGSAGVPSLTATSLPRVGQPFRLQVTGIPAFSAGALYFAFDDRWLGGNTSLPLPIDLGFLGAAGCYANVDIAGPGTTAPFLIGSALGIAELQFVIPPDVRVLGFQIFNQFLSLDPLAARSLGIATTNAGRAIVGW